MTQTDDPRDSRRLKAVLVFAGTLAFVVSPFFAPSFGGYDPSSFPVPQQRPLVSPAPYAFSIWTVIYVWLVLHAGWSLFARADDPDWDAPRWPLFGSVALGASWLAVASTAPLFATVQIWVMLVLALLALFRAPAARERWLLRAPISLYAGWLTAAASVSLGIMLAGFGVTGAVAAAVIGLALATGIAIAVQTRLPEAPLYAVAVVWALIGVIVNDIGRAPLLAALAALAAVAVGFVAWRGWRQAVASKS